MEKLEGEFKVLINGKLKTFNDYNKIPMSFENLISFKFDVPPEPHTQEQHDEINKWPDRMKELMKRETK